MHFLFVSETKRIDTLSHDLQTQINRGNRYDEYGSFSRVEMMKKVNHRTYIIDGLFTIHDLNDVLGMEIQSNMSDTVSGLLIEQLGYIPKEEDRSVIKIQGLQFEILKVREKRGMKACLKILVEEEKS